MPMVSHDHKSHVTPHFDFLDVINAVLLLMIENIMFYLILIIFP